MDHHMEHRDRSVPRPEASIDATCVRYFAPGHLARCGGEMRYKLAATYVTFDPTGQQLLVNMGGEQVYLFDVNNHKDNVGQELKVPDGFLVQKGGDEIECCCGVLLFNFFTF